MKTREQRILNTMLRVQTFKKKRIGDFQPNGKAVKCFEKNDQLLLQAGQLGLIQTTGGTQAHGGTVSKEAHEEHLRVLLRAIVQTGRRAFRTEPAIESKFRNPLNGTNNELLTDTQALRALADTHKQVFLDSEMPADFLDELDEALADWTGDGGTQDEGDQESAGATNAVGQLLRDALANIRDLDPMVRNRYRADAQATGEWQTASHLEVAARTAATTTQTTTPQP